MESSFTSSRETADEEVVFPRVDLRMWSCAQVHEGHAAFRSPSPHAWVATKVTTVKDQRCPAIKKQTKTDSTFKTQCFPELFHHEIFFFFYHLLMSSGISFP